MNSETYDQWMLVYFCSLAICRQIVQAISLLCEFKSQ
jgi:hypothetical protein